jgi:Mg2+/Co2+ transporter CorB
MFNRATGWKLPTSGPKTLNGLIVEFLEDIPQPGTALRLGAYTLEIAAMEDNVVRSVRIRQTEEVTG